MYSSQRISRSRAFESGDVVVINDDDEDDDDDDEEDGGDTAHAARPRIADTIGRGSFSPSRSHGHFAEVDEDAQSVASASQKATGSAFTQYINSLPSAQRERTESEATSIAKSNMLADLERLRAQGIPLSRTWTMRDDADDMAFELKRLTIQVDEANNIGMMQNGLQLACTGIEMLSKRYKVLDLDGWSTEVCQDMSKYNTGLGRLYRKYWRRSHNSSPEADILMSLVGSMGMYHMRRTLTRTVMGGGRTKPGGTAPGLFGKLNRAPAPRRSAPNAQDDSSDSDDAEGLPP